MAEEKITPPIPSVTFVGYQGGELVWNTVETRASSEADTVLLNAKQWPGARKLGCTYERIQAGSFEYTEGAVYAGKDLETALNGFQRFYEEKIAKLNKHLKVAEVLDQALADNDDKTIKAARAS